MGGLLLPASGLFMSVIYPTINSKGISCVPKAEHGAGAGVILFFTCVSAVLGPAGHGRRQRRARTDAYGFWLATGLAGLLFPPARSTGWPDPTRSVLERARRSNHEQELSNSKAMGPQRYC